MAKKTCVFCGHTVGTFASFSESIYEVEPSEWGKTPLTHLLLPINGAPKGLGFCDAHGCAKNLYKVLSFLFYNDKISRPISSPGPFSAKFEKASPEVLDALNYCKVKVNNVPDPIIKAQVLEWIRLADETITEVSIKQQQKSIRHTGLMKFFDAEKCFFNNLDYSFESNNGGLFGFDNNILFLRQKKEIYNSVVGAALDNYSQDYDFSDVLHSAILKIPLDNIIYFKEIGKVDYLAKVNGGKINGGGVNTDGALAGGMIFGAAGAIVGSQLGTEIQSTGINTTVETVDTRQVSLRYKDSNDKIAEEIYPYEVFDFLMKVIPEKEITIVNLESQKEKTFTVFKESSQNNNRFEEIKKFKELLDCGIITEEEFQIKKAELLNL